MLKTDLGEFINCLSDAINLINVGAGIGWDHAKHSHKVCYIAQGIAEQMHLDEDTRSDLHYAALLHDSGVCSTQQAKVILEFDTAREFDHCKRGYELLNKSPYMKRFAQTVLHHHDKWAGPNESGISGSDIPLCSRIIFVADRVDVLISTGEGYILLRSDDIVRAINEHSVTHFDPQVVDAFNQTACRESFWLDLTVKHTRELLDHSMPKRSIQMDYSETEAFAEIFSQIVDSKSRFTSQHSKRVARVAVELAKRLKFSLYECNVMKIAGLLHDIGKLVIPDEVLEKPDKLTRAEYEIIKQHVYFSHLLLSRLSGFETVAQWGPLHHERLDGRGYPFRLNGAGVSLGSRIMAVSDVFTAVAEDRPYRRGYAVEKVCGILKKQTDEGALDGDIVNVVTKDIDTFYGCLKVENHTEPMR